MKQLFEELNRYEVYDNNEHLINVFDDETEAINFAMQHDANYVDLSGKDSADFERIWTNNGEDFEQCWSCEDWFEKPELLKTDTGYLCQRCYDGLRSHGEPITVFYGYDDDIPDFVDEDLNSRMDPKKKRKENAILPDYEKGMKVLNHNLGADKVSNSTESSSSASTGAECSGSCD